MLGILVAKNHILYLFVSVKMIIVIVLLMINCLVQFRIIDILTKKE